MKRRRRRRSPSPPPLVPEEIDALIDVTQLLVARLENSIVEATEVARALEVMRDEATE